MTTVSLELLRRFQSSTPEEAWEGLFAYAWKVCSPQISIKRASNEVLKRDRAIAPIDLFLATAGWDLWSNYYDAVPRTTERLAVWWSSTMPGRAILILDGLSLREVPWIIYEAAARGYTVHSTEVTGAELPADTNPFARALGIGQRSMLENNGAGNSHKLQGAKTDSTSLPWYECVDMIDTSVDWVLWHHWPDERIHDLGVPGHGLAALAEEAAKQLASDAFWKLIERLAKGRRLIITGDHGYAATGLFPDVVDTQQSEYLKSNFKSGRSSSGKDYPSNWVPPIDLVLETPHGSYSFVLGRRKWKSAGGYPTLAHGGLSLLEVAVPFIELSKSIEG